MSSEHTRIALDAMGGDAAPAATVEGALQAVQRDEALEVCLVGQEDAVRAELDRLDVADALRARLPVVHAPQVVSSSDVPVEALRSKPESSIRVATELVARREASGLVAAGNTGATVACAMMVLRNLPGVRRTGIAVELPARGGEHTILCDVGANISCRPLHLYHYGIMASRYAEGMFGVTNPTVGLLNVGSEDTKGTELVRETAALFAKAQLNFIGHVEGNDVFSGRCDVIVCEGFVGNVVLKTAEGLYETLAATVMELATPEMGKTLMKDLQRRMDWAEHGGAPLLGANGLVLISHGRSDARAIRSALLQAARLSRRELVRRMIEDIEASA